MKKALKLALKLCSTKLATNVALKLHYKILCVFSATLLKIISKVWFLADYFNMEVEHTGTMHKMYIAQDTRQKF